MPEIYSLSGFGITFPSRMTSTPEASSLLKVEARSAEVGTRAARCASARSL